MWICCVDDLDRNYSPTWAEGAALGGQNIQWETYECGPLNFYQVLRNPEGWTSYTGGDISILAGGCFIPRGAIGDGEPPNARALDLRGLSSAPVACKCLHRLYDLDVLSAC